jgi:hypothetical protein
MERLDRVMPGRVAFCMCVRDSVVRRDCFSHPGSDMFWERGLSCLAWTNGYRESHAIVLLYMSDRCLARPVPEFDS